MDEKWIEFDDGPSMPRDRIYVSMSRIGEIMFNRHADEAMGRPEAVVLLFEPNTNKIGLRPASPLMPNAFPVKPKGPCGHRLVRAKPFMKKHDMRLDGTVRFRSAVVENGILILCLRSMQNVKRQKPNTRRR
jgi:hypothetical protein